MNMSDFILTSKVSMTAELVDRNPHMSDMPDGSTHWRCVFKRGKSRLTIPFSMGPAHTREPEAADVLDCLASDSAGYENAQSFEDWCAEYGYDTDSRKAERIYRTCEAQADKLKAFLGPEAYDTLLWDTDRL
jgi:hypothetical protein